jgi:flagellar basal-body rod protein FlgG
MIRALVSAATGMGAQQTNLDTIANNLANVNTIGFKKNQVMFEDLLYDNIRPVAAQQGSGGSSVPAGANVGLGTNLVSTSKVFTPGSLINTGNSTDLAINGNGFFRIQLPDGTFGYTRAGAFNIDSTGKWVTPDGLYLEGAPPLAVDRTALAVTSNGTISQTVNGTTSSIGQLLLYRFTNPSGLQSMGQNLYTPTGASGDALAGTPGQDGFGQLQQGYQEGSNVDVVQEMVNLITAQRAYEMNTKAVQASDEILQSTNNMKR